MAEASSQKLSPQFLMIAEVLIRMRHFCVHIDYTPRWLDGQD